ncbi:glycoside hydrolase family 36 protein [Purpureocillium lavendulum]|uniref:Glycoside hydrolase family 36 protein n=1 Tax=Purpureocillium lavendulum TaxID=1247861 RepID=A0AB34FTV7_9HYPO|nr:glycoside hydrolase family 36 protein [Purpureocillium lavendulum]
MTVEKYDFSKEFKKIYISKQRPAPDPVAEEMKVRLQSHPPLGQVTRAEGGKLSLTAILEVPRARAQEPWEVALWLTVDGAEWREHALDRVEIDHQPQSLHPADASLSCTYFAGGLTFSNSIQFTLKLRGGQDQPWRWIRDEQGLNDGLVVAQTPAVLAGSLHDVIPDLSSAWKVKEHMSQAPQTKLWSLEADIANANGDASTFRDIDVGTPWGAYLRWFALVRLWAPWLAPRQGKDHLHLDQDAIMCSFLSPQGKTVTLLALSGVGNVLSTFRHTDRGGARNDGSSGEAIIILISQGNDFDHTVASVMYHARSIVSKIEHADSSWEADLRNFADQVKPEWKQNWYDGLGFCTWNGLGQGLTEQAVLDAVGTLAEHKVNVTSLIIDDNWQSIDYKGDGQFQYAWLEFEAEPKAFPNGLKSVVSRIRKEYPDIQHIAVWHALLGYWGGISPGGKIDQTYKTIEVIREDSKRRNLPLGGKMTVVAKEDVQRFYDDFYRFLTEAGVDGVKTDAQFMVDMWTSASARRDLIKTYLDAWTRASLRYFSVKAISCMSQFPQALFHSQLPQNRPPLLVRNSDDFFPEIPASHPWHVWANAHNSIFMQYLNVLPDWDMFQTVHDYSGFHAAARCVSGGPIYITDVPGKHNMELIHQMTGVTVRGKTIIFRPSVLGRSIYPYTGYDDDLLLKVGSFHGASQTGTGILGLFNISARPLLELIPLADFPGTSASSEYVVRAHNTGKVSKPMTPGSPGSLTPMSLDVRGYEILCAFPLTSFAGPKHKNGRTCTLGLIGKMTGCAAIVSSSVRQRGNGRVSVTTRLKALGVLGVYVSTLPRMTIDGDFMVTIQDKPVPRGRVSVSRRAECVLEVDVATAWDEMGLGGGRGDEVEVTVDFDA